MMEAQNKSLAPQVLDAVSVFICPIKIGKIDRKSLENGWQARSLEYQNVSHNDKTETIQLYAFPNLKETIQFSTKKIECTILPYIGFAKISDWAVIALEIRFNNSGFPLSFEDLLLFNVGFRRTQGEPEQQDSFFGTNPDDLKLADGKSSSSIYSNLAQQIIGEYKPLDKLTKALLLSYAKFSHSLSDDDLYRFGSVAFPNEPATEEWTAQMRENIFDRWKSSGWRCFVYSYSLIYALANSVSFAGRQDERIQCSFLQEYFRMGISIAIQRAWLQEFFAKIQKASNMDIIRKCHDEMVSMESHFGLTWTAEGTQRVRIEQLWRKATGVDDRMTEARLLLEQKVAFEEAMETEQLTQKTTDLNKMILYLQFIFGIMYGAQIGLAIFDTNKIVGSVAGGIAGFLVIITILKFAGLIKAPKVITKTKHKKEVKVTDSNNEQRSDL